jgi:hypothetical protein
LGILFFKKTFNNNDKQAERTTGGFVQVGHDVVTSAKFRHRLQFQRDEQQSATE